MGGMDRFLSSRSLSGDSMISVAGGSEVGSPARASFSRCRMTFLSETTHIC